LYEGSRGRQGRVTRRVEPLELRVVVATALAIGAATSSWREPLRTPHGSARVELLAPRGSLEAAPRAVVWSSAVTADRVRIVFAGRDGEVVVDKWIDGSGTTARLDAEERRLAVERSACSIQLFAVDPEGELLGASVPARITLPGSSPER
jgi:hypothetical protein